MRFHGLANVPCPVCTAPRQTFGAFSVPDPASLRDRASVEVVALTIAHKVKKNEVASAEDLAKHTGVRTRSPLFDLEPYKFSFVSRLRARIFIIGF